MRVDLESPILAVSESARARVTVDGCMGRYGQWLRERRSESKGGPFRVWGCGVPVAVDCQIVCR